MAPSQLALHEAAHVLVGLRQPRFWSGWRCNHGRAGDHFRAQIQWADPTTPRGELLTALAGPIADALYYEEEDLTAAVVGAVSDGGDRSDGAVIASMVAYLDQDRWAWNIDHLKIHAPDMWVVRLDDRYYVGDYIYDDGILDDEIAEVVRLLEENQAEWHALAEWFDQEWALEPGGTCYADDALDAGIQIPTWKVGTGPVSRDEIRKAWGLEPYPDFAAQQQLGEA